ncbi:MAG: ABC transporter permease, partial [Acidobacteriaceae bacterium]|nr:ABC transporter permease [Acidobacteriaceae bacterium]
DIGAFAMEEDLAFIGRGTPDLLRTNRVSANFLHILGVSPLLGAGSITPDHTVVISYDLWQRRFNGNFQVAGQAINLAGESYTISGVLPPGFAFPAAGVDVWLSRPEESPKFAPQSRALSPFLTVFGRLNSGVTLEQTTAELKVIQTSYARSHPAMLDARPKSPPAAVPLQRALVSSVRLELWLLFGAVVFLLLIACANLASLLLARAAARATEFAIRSALGASAAQIVKHLLAETLILSLLGGSAGAFLAFLTLSAIRRIAGAALPRSGEIQFDAPVAAFAIAVSLLTALLLGLTPSLRVSRADLMTVLRTRDANSGHLRLRGLLVVTQVALSLVLLIGATLVMESILHLRGEVLGFDAQNLLTARIALPPGAHALEFFDDLLTRITSLPEVEHASVSLTLPMTSYPGTPVQDSNQPLLPLNQRPIAAIFIVSPDYFQTLRVPLRRGRTFTPHDREGTKRVAVIDEGLARYLWSAYPARQNPVGQHILIGGVNKVPAEIIGVVADVHQSIENAGWNRSVYVPFAQLAVPSAMVAIRVKDNPTRFTGALRHAVQSLNPAQPVSEVQPMQALVDAQLGARRVLLQVLGFFAFVAFILAVVGIYGLISYSVSRRTQELGIRRALGASHNNILRMVLIQTLRLALAGVIVGTACAIGVTKFLKGYLFHISAIDPATFVGVSVLFLAVAVGAALPPALRAANVQPLRALRHE